ncbi:GntR family transcriptional regulator [Neobacillus cucumis]|uniref:GntR family transcriptional regulator n=1 Tax=Neobacillus cucumis TaxID=1740721 RepID=UPI00203FF8BA|nr:GntR family transcriptional regulator [Neobacillus cucumis]MCM3727428.1 GntR family transcriptional regulator [Neobacillus cucumis]
MNLQNISSGRETLSNHAYQVIRDAIVTLQFEPGQQVFEAELGNQLGVSRTPIREAFRRLLAEELIEVQPQRGNRIAYLSKKKIDEARFVRVSLEVSAFKEVAKKWDQNNPIYQTLHKQIVDILENQKKMAEDHNFDLFLQLDEQFHYTILESMGNATLISIINQMRGHLNRLRYLELQETKHFIRLVNEHESIFEAILSNDARKTEELLTSHIRWLEDSTQTLIEKYPHFFKD